MVKILIGRILFADGIIRKGSVSISNGKIVDVSSSTNSNYKNDHEVLDFSDNIIAPGYIDIHTHGGSGHDVIDGSTSDIIEIAKMYLKHGVTSFLPTTVSSSQDMIIKSLRSIKSARNKKVGSNILGVHLEGPFINKDMKGAQNPIHIGSQDIDFFNNIIEEANGLIKIITLAPEIKGIENIIKILKEKNIIISIGHSDATYYELMDAISLGASQVTHLFNAMNKLHHREPGIPGGALISKRLKVQIIGDGNHINPVIVKLILNTKGCDNVILISDSMRATDIDDGVYSSGGLKVIVKEGIAKLEDGTLAGSTLTLDQAVKNLVNWGLTSISDAVKMASYNPAKEIGFGNSKGLIENGRDADIIVLDKQLNVIMTMIAGEIVFNLN